MSAPIDWDALLRAAQDTAANAHAPYSRFQVGAALLCADGRVFTGCNVENASFGLTLCAERNAVSSAVAHGCRQFTALALVTSSEHPVTPCGACRQVFAEFAPSFAVRCYGQGGRWLDTSSLELLPHAFDRSDFTDP